MLNRVGFGANSILLEIKEVFFQRKTNVTVFKFASKKMFHKEIYFLKLFNKHEFHGFIFKLFLFSGPLKGNVPK